MTMQTVAFYSYKGGVGRTLLVANTAQFLAMSGRKVVALDLDLEAPGLHQKLGSREDLNQAKGGTLRGAVDELLDILRDEPGSRSLQETAINVPLPDDAKEGFLRVIPAGAAPSHAYWAALDKLNNTLRANPRKAALPEAVFELQARIEEAFAPDFLLIDSRTGITELGSLATSLLADRVVCLTTTATESVEGTKVVADALRKAPRLSSQEPLRVEFLITRVVSSGSSVVTRVEKELKELGGSVKQLPHDSAIANEERLLSARHIDRSEEKVYPYTHDTHVDARPELFSAMLDWIKESFPGHKEQAERARARMVEIHEAWQILTRPGRYYSNRDTGWPTDQLRERVIFKGGKTSRHADIVAYDSVRFDATPLMVIEYVVGEDREAVADWWLAHTKVQAVVILPEIRKTEYEPDVRVISRARVSGRYTLPLPHDFKALADPADTSVGAMLEAVQRGYPEYLDRIVTEWIRCSGAPRGPQRFPWKPKISKRIVDGLVQVNEAKLAREVLWAVSRAIHHRGMWSEDRGEGLEDQILAELFVPLLWRLPADASIEILREGSHHRMPHGRPSGLMALASLAQEILGLHYDPDATFRIEGQRILDRSRRKSETDHDRDLYRLIPAFETAEISFEASSELPPLAVNEANEHENARNPENIGRLVSERIADRSLVTTGLLGNYEPAKGRVVLYIGPIGDCAGEMHLQPRHVGSVTLIHETLHALMHLGRDLDGRMWPEFALPDPSSPLFEPSWFHETLTQYFTYQHILRLRDPALMHAFETMSAKSAAPYRAWERLRNLPIEDARNWLMSVRRGVGAGSIPMQLVLEGMRPET